MRQVASASLTFMLLMNMKRRAADQSVLAPMSPVTTDAAPPSDAVFMNARLWRLRASKIIGFSSCSSQARPFAPTIPRRVDQYPARHKLMSHLKILPGFV
jgi:hypothetical protein